MGGLLAKKITFLVLAGLTVFFLLGNFSAVALASSNIVLESPLVVSEEFGGQTIPPTNEDPLPPSGGDHGSGEGSFTTLSADGASGPVASNEGNFTTKPGDSMPLLPVVSSEMSFTTASGNGGGMPTPPLKVSGEMSFTTLLVSTTPPPSGVSGEGSFTTAGPPPGGGGPTTPPSGGGGSGFVSRPSGQILPPPCELYLKKFIKLGADNDPEEVRKLEAFLRVFEGFDIPVNGVYEPHDFEAVKIFQQRYAQAVLTPWGLAANDPTGYVYITTSLTINQIYCHRTVGNSLDLRNVFPVYGPAAASDEAPIVGLESTTTPTTTPSILELPGFLQAAVGLLNFLKDWWCLLLIILLILIIAYLLDERERLNKRLKDIKDNKDRQIPAEPVWPEPFEEIVINGQTNESDVSQTEVK
jgi:hypothetical protein